jgi:hypothetical protein
MAFFLPAFYLDVKPFRMCPSSGCFIAIWDTVPVSSASSPGRVQILTAGDKNSAWGDRKASRHHV